jgi:hypothetical protein
MGPEAYIWAYEGGSKSRLEKNYIMKSFRILPLTNSDDRNQEMEGAYGTYGEEVHRGFW